MHGKETPPLDVDRAVEHGAADLVIQGLSVLAEHTVTHANARAALFSLSSRRDLLRSVIKQHELQGTRTHTFEQQTKANSKKKKKREKRRNYHKGTKNAE